MKIDEAQHLVDTWIKEKGVRYFDPLTNMAILTEEVGEVARIMARRYGEQSEKDTDKAKDLGASSIFIGFHVLVYILSNNIKFKINLVANVERMKCGVVKCIWYDTDAELIWFYINYG